MDKIKRFLIIRLDEIGDYILTAPLLRELKRNFPEAEIDLIVKPSLIGFVSGSPYVSRVWGAEVKRRKLLRNWRLFLILLLRRMRCGRYGIAILPRPSPDRSCSRLLAWIAGAEKILAYSTSLAGPDQWIPTTLLQKENEHNVSSNLRFLDSLGIHAYDASLHLKDLWKDEISADQWKSRICWSSDRKYALCSPCSISEIKNWGKENYCEVIRRLFTELGYVTILTGSQDDSGTVDWICAHSPQGSCVSLCGKTELGDLPSVMRLGSFYFGADTSAVHFAAAAGLPCVVLTPHAHGYEGWLSAETRFCPWQVPCRIVTPPARIPPCGMECRGPGSHCITGISADTVFESILELYRAGSFSNETY